MTAVDETIDGWTLGGFQSVPAQGGRSAIIGRPLAPESPIIATRQELGRLLAEVEATLAGCLDEDDPRGRAAGAGNALIQLQQIAAALDPERRPPYGQELHEDLAPNERFRFSLVLARCLCLAVGDGGVTNRSLKILMQGAIEMLSGVDPSRVRLAEAAMDVVVQSRQ